MNCFSFASLPFVIVPLIALPTLSGLGVAQHRAVEVREDAEEAVELSIRRSRLPDEGPAPILRMDRLD